MRKLKIRHLVILTVLFTTVLAMSACGKKNLHKEGENTNYPFTWEVKKNGTVLVNLDGSYSPDYAWNFITEDEDIATVEAKKEEKKGKITYQITPKAEGNFSIEFVREKQAPAVAAPSSEESPEEGITKEEEIRQEQANDPVETSETDSETGSESADDGVIYDDEGSTGEEEVEPEHLVEPGGVYISGYDENDNPIDGEIQIIGGDTPEEAIENAISYETEENDVKIPVDRVCRISMTIDFSPKGNSTKKFEGEGTVLGIRETDGLRTGVKDNVSYILWADSNGDLRLILTGVEEVEESAAWIISKNTTYTGTAGGNTADGEAPAVTYEEPEKDEEGNYKVLEVLHDGYYNGCPVFLISAIDDGTGDVSIELVGNKITFVMSLEFSRSRINVKSCELQ